MSEKEFIIPFVGLKQGVHEFAFEIGNKFFESIEYSIIEKGQVTVKLALDKKETMLVGDFSLHGTVESSCARCTEPVDSKVEGEFQLVYKFDNKPSEDESLVIVYPEEFEIDVKASILEFISVSLPSRTVHEEGDCNEEITGILSEYQVFKLDDSSEDDYEDEGFDELDDDSEDNEDEGLDENQEDNDDDQNGDDDYIDPRWAALKKLK
jgi:uncharacterized metal-binding protein YceD (DUF177 family)